MKANLKQIYFQQQVDPFVKAFLVSDALLYSALNIVTVFFAVYASTRVSGGSIGAATWSLSLGYGVRIVTELSSGKTISRQTEANKTLIIIAGMILIGLAYAGLGLSPNAAWLYVWWALGGLGWGLALPTKLAVVSGRVNPEQSTQEWGLNDAANMSLIAVTTAICGFAVTRIGIQPLLITAAGINVAAAVPYLVFMRHGTKLFQPLRQQEPAPGKAG